MNQILTLLSFAIYYEFFFLLSVDCSINLLSAIWQHKLNMNNGAIEMRILVTSPKSIPVRWYQMIIF